MDPETTTEGLNSLGIKCWSFIYAAEVTHPSWDRYGHFLGISLTNEPILLPARPHSVDPEFLPLMDRCGDGTDCLESRKGTDYGNGKQQVAIMCIRATGRLDTESSKLRSQEAEAGN